MYKYLPYLIVNYVLLKGVCHCR